MSWAWATGSSVSITRPPIAPITRRSSAWAQTPPNMLFEAPIAAAGLPVRALSPLGREAQSRAFLSWPGREWLYSGVAIRTASASLIASRSSRTASGAGPASASSSNGGISASRS